MLLLIRSIETYAPEAQGTRDILVAGGAIERIEDSISLPDSLVTVVDGAGLAAVPGFIDGHVHLTGGGGEGGFRTRTPELVLSDAVRGGVTTVVGCLGTDGVTRSVTALLAKARGLEEEGISTFIYTGSYGVPPPTITGSVESDIVLIDKVIGAGEIAVSDHRSSQPVFEEIARIAGEARRGGILSGKAGVVDVHMGDGARRLELLERVVAETEIPITQFVPTHINRNPRLFESGVDWARRGGFVDLTTSVAPQTAGDQAITAGQGLKRMLDAGVPIDRISFTSDGQGSVPVFDARGSFVGLGVGSVGSLFGEVRRAVVEGGVSIATAIQAITSTPAAALKLKTKGRLATGLDADIVLLRKSDWSIHSVIARGRPMMRAGDLLARGTFEPQSG